MYRILLISKFIIPDTSRYIIIVSNPIYDTVASLPYFVVRNDGQTNMFLGRQY